MEIIKKNHLTFTFVLLVSLTIVGYLLVLEPIQTQAVQILVLLVCGIKFALIFFSFMDMRKAHRFWKYLGVGFLVSLVAVMMGLYNLH